MHDYLTDLHFQLSCFYLIFYAKQDCRYIFYMVDIIPNSQEIIGHGTFSIIYKARLIVSLHLNLLSKNMNLNHALYERALFFYVLINSVFVKNKITMNEIFVFVLVNVNSISVFFHFLYFQKLRYVLKIFRNEKIISSVGK